MECKSVEFEASIVSTSGNPADPEPTTVLHLSAPLTVALADSLRCRDMAYTLNDNARRFEGEFGLPLELGEDDADIVLPGYGGGQNTIRPFKIWKFKVHHVTDLTLGVKFRVHFKGASDSQIVNDLLHEFNQSAFSVRIVSTQGELFAEKAPEMKGDGPEGGTRVDMTADAPLFGKPAKAKSGCKVCDAGIPLKPNDDSEHVNGEGCKLWDKPANPAPPMETAVLQDNSRDAADSVDPATFEPTIEQPNEHGVYLCDPTVFFEKKVGKLFGSIDALLIAPDEWVSALKIDAPKKMHSEPLSNSETYTTLGFALGVKAFAGEKMARAQINLHKGAAAVAWLELAGWFQQQWTKRRPDSFETVEDWATYLEGITEPEPVGAEA